MTSEHSLHNEPAIPHESVWAPPESARVPEGSSYFAGEDDGYCRVLKPDGARCQGVRMKDTGLCPPHSGRSKVLDDPRGMQARGAAGKVRARERRALLVSNGINPRLAAREAAIRRSDAIVRALVDDPLDDPDLSSRGRQKAMLELLDATFPMAQVSAEIELPADPDAMSWAEMQRMAAQLSEGIAEG